MLGFREETGIFEFRFDRKQNHDTANFKIELLRVPSSVAPLDCCPAKKHCLALVRLLRHLR